MARAYEIYIVPRDSNDRPSARQAAQLFEFLAERLKFAPELSVDGREGFGLASAAERFKIQCGALSGRAEIRVEVDGERVSEIFGGSPYAEDPDERFWAQELRICLTSEPFPYADWEYEDAYCHVCSRRFEGIRDILEELRPTGRPLACGCGVKAPPHQLKTTSGVRLAQLAIVFAGNEGWHHDVEDDREVFEDPEFLPALEEILGGPIEVLAIAR